MIQYIKTIYHEPTAGIKVNGNLSNWIQLERGSRQVCCLSPTLFALYAEAVNTAGKENTDIIGHFADDVIIFLEQPDISTISQT